MSKKTRLLGRLKHVYSHNAKLVLDVDNNDIGLIIEGVEKQIAKKPTHEATILKCHTCPNCKNVLDRFEKWGNTKCLITTKYCWFCGQKLDWNEVE